LVNRKLGLVIGNSAYRDSTLARLDTPDVDVGDLADVLLDPDIGAFDDVKVLVNASSNIVRRAISSFFAAKGREDLLLFYFSGHGVLDTHGRLFLAVKDTERPLLRATAIPAAFITDEMNNSRSQRQLLILDCCHSGAFARGTKGSLGASVGTSSAFEGTGYGRVVMTATDATQYAWEGDQTIGEPVNSVFTHYLIGGLKSGAADANNDGRITIDELYDYAYGQVVKETPEQTPGKWTYKEQGEIVIAQNPRWRPSPVIDQPTGDVDEDVDRRLASLYTKGLSAYWLEEWDKAQSAFNAIVELRPDYKDAATKLDEAKQQEKLARLYEQGKRASEKRDWQTAIEAFKSLRSEAPDYKDAAKLLAAAQGEKRLADLYAEAQHLYEARQYAAVIKVFENLAAEQPGLEDPEGLLAKAQLEQQALEKQRTVEEAYNRAVQALDAGRLQEAQRLLWRVQEMEPGFEQVERLLSRIKGEMAPAEVPSPEPIAPAREVAAPDGINAITRLLSLETLAGWVERARAGWTEKAAGAKRRAGDWEQVAEPKTTSVTGIAGGIAWRILLISAGWFAAGWLPAFLFYYYPTFEAFPNYYYWFDRIDELYGYGLGHEGVGFVLLSAVAGLLAGIVLWVARRSAANRNAFKYMLLMAGGWLLAFVVASSLAWIWARDIGLMAWLLAGGLGGALGGLFTSLILWQPDPERRQAIMRMAIGGALGLGSGFLIAELMGGALIHMSEFLPGWLLSRRIGIAIAGVVVGWFLLDERLVKDRLGIYWRTVLFGAGGFFLAALPLNYLFEPVWIFDDAFLIYLALLGFIGTSLFAMPSKSPKRMITLGVMGGAGLILGHLLLILVLRQENDFFAPAFWGLGLGAVLALRTRGLPVVIMLGLLCLAAFVITFHFFLSLVPEDAISPFMFAVVWGLNGGFVAFLYEIFVKPSLAAA
jgi:tetratricopeptide (TPR) repeat protein